MNTPQCGPKGRRSADFDPANTDQASDFGSDSGRFGPKRTPKTPPILGLQQVLGDSDFLQPYSTECFVM